MSDIETRVREYVGSKAPSQAPPVEGVIARARQARARRRRWFAAGTSAAVVVAAAGVAAGVLGDSHGDTQGKVASGKTDNSASRDTSSGSPSSAGIKPALTVRIDGAKIIPFSLPTLAQFASSGAVSQLLIGTVAAAQPHVSDDGTTSVETVMTLKTQDRRGKLPSKTVTVKEIGGVVRLREVRADFESKIGPIPADKLDELVDYTNGTTHPAVGQRVLVFVEELPAGDIAQYVSLARMSYDPGTNKFAWAGEAPNPEWLTSLTQSQVATNFAPLVQDR